MHNGCTEFTYMHGMQCPSCGPILYAFYLELQMPQLLVMQHCNAYPARYPICHTMLWVFFEIQKHIILDMHILYSRFLIATLHSYNYSMINQVQ